jgi:tetratricopeptide (TPR) repeat protein
VTVPVLGLTERPHYPSDRYGHLPNIVWAVAISIGLFRVWPKRGMRAAGVAVSIFAAGLCALMSFWQTAIWKDSISLLEATLESLGSSNYRGDIASRLGSLHSKAGNLQRAGECFEIFRVTGWKSEWAHVDAATFWLQQNRLDLAQFHADEALTRSPKSFAANEVKANVLAKEGRFTEAVSFYQAALKAEPNNGKTHSNLGVAFANLNRHDEAVAALRSAVQCEPLNWANHFNLAIALEAKGEIFVAITSYRRAIEIRPDLIDAQRRLAELYLKKDEPKEAVAVLRDGIRRLPNSVPLLEALASLLATHPDGNVRNGAESVALASEAVRLTAEASPQPLNALAAAFAAQGQFSDAVKTQERALSLMETSKQETVVAEMRHRLALYRTNQPFRASPAPQRSNPAGIK